MYDTTLDELIREYFNIKRRVSTYRFGQHFANRCLKDDSMFPGLWNAEYKEAFDMVVEICDEYNWNHSCIPTLQEPFDV